MSQIKILVVEDEKLVADDLRETLELLGYQVPAMATTGEEAILKVGLVQPDLVLMDIRLAGALDGIEASHIIRTQSQVPIVYLTANADLPTLERVKASQPFGYILKPFNEKVLATTIEIALSRHEAEASVRKTLSEVQHTQETIRSQIQQQSEYLSLVAHELRNPLTAIKFAAEVLHSQDINLTEEKRQKFIQRIQIAAQSLNALLEDVLVLERTSANRLEYSPIPMDLAEFCDEIVETFRITSGEFHTFTFIVEGDRRPLQGDEKLLWHLLNNLLSNATKYSPQGGEVIFQLRFDPKQVQIQVRDHGIGIPANALQELFTPFQRAGNVGHIPGTGLGLSIVKQCVELHQGQIYITSKEQQGTTVTVTLPYHPASS